MIAILEIISKSSLCKKVCTMEMRDDEKVGAIVKLKVDSWDSGANIINYGLFHVITTLN
jgi:hypothetical protein